MKLAARIGTMAETHTGWVDGYYLFLQGNREGYVTSFLDPIPVVPSHMIAVTGADEGTRLIGGCHYLDANLNYVGYFGFYNRSVTVPEGAYYIIFCTRIGLKDSVKITDTTTGTVLFEHGRIVNASSVTVSSSKVGVLNA